MFGFSYGDYPGCYGSPLRPKTQPGPALVHRTRPPLRRDRHAPYLASLQLPIDYVLANVSNELFQVLSVHRDFPIECIALLF